MFWVSFFSLQAPSGQNHGCPPAVTRARVLSEARATFPYCRDFSEYRVRGCVTRSPWHQFHRDVPRIPRAVKIMEMFTKNYPHVEQWLGPALRLVRQHRPPTGWTGLYVPLFHHGVRAERQTRTCCPRYPRINTPGQKGDVRFQIVITSTGDGKGGNATPN